MRYSGSIVRLVQGALSSGSCLLFAACGGGGSGTGTQFVENPEPAAFAVGGAVAGLSGIGLVLRNNGGDDLAIDTAGAFTFARAQQSASAFDVTVFRQPANPVQTCTVLNGAGIVAVSRITTVEVHCVDDVSPPSGSPPSDPAPTTPPAPTEPPAPQPLFTVGGTVTGLFGAPLVLRNLSSKTANELVIAANGPFAFPAGVPAGTLFNVVVATQPDHPVQSCVVNNSSGTVGGSNVVSIAVSCHTLSPLTLVESAPVNAAQDVDRRLKPMLTFSAPLDAATVSSQSVHLYSEVDSEHVQLTTAGKSITLQPQSKLLPLTQYQVKVDTSVRGATGEELVKPMQTNFTTSDGHWQASGTLASGENAFRPRAAVDAQGNILLVWQMSADPAPQVWAQLFVAGAWLSPERLDDDDFYSGDPEAAFDAAGNAIVVWTSLEHGIWSRRYRGAGSSGSGAWEPIERLDDGSAALRWVAHVAVAPSGAALAVWSQKGATGSDSMHAARYSATATGESAGWSDAKIIQADLSHHAFNYQVAMHADGTGFAIWSQSDPVHNIYANRYDGHDWGLATRINVAAMPGSYPQIAIDQRGVATAVWDQDGADGDGTFGIWTSRYSATGLWSKPLRISSETGSAEYPRIALDARGNARVAWVQYSFELNGATHVRSSRYFARENFWDEAQQVDAGFGSVAPTAVRIATDRAGNALILWLDKNQTAHARRSRVNADWSDELTFGPAYGWDLDVVIDASGDGTVFWRQYFALGFARFE